MKALRTTYLKFSWLHNQDTHSQKFLFKPQFPWYLSLPPPLIILNMSNFFLYYFLRPPFFNFWILFHISCSLHYYWHPDFKLKCMAILHINLLFTTGFLNILFYLQNVHLLLWVYIRLSSIFKSQAYLPSYKFFICRVL